jgi:LytS/YehU family sensor histidine kinase
MKKETVFDIKVWVGVALLMPFLINNYTSSSQRLVQAFLAIILVITLFYAHKWLIQNFLIKKKWLKFSFGLVCLIASATYLFSMAITYILGKTEHSLIVAFANVITFLFFSTAISYAYKGILLQIQYEKTKRRQVEAELKLLQSQVNPHFLFNTLNNIYAQNLIHQEEASDMILQLADLMRYQIKSAKKNDVNIHDEVEFLENYIALEKKRLTDKTQVHFSFEKQDDTPLSIPPMLFIPFVENAFKYGIGTEGGNFIKIHLAVKTHEILFEIENSIPTRKQSVKSTKMGLDNIKKRLDLLFPDKYKLDIKTEIQVYSVHLNIRHIRK